MSRPLVLYVLTAALRDRLVMAMIITLVVGTSLAVFLGSAAIAEKQQFALVFAGAGLRLAGVLGLVLFTVFFIRRSFDARDVDFILSRPVSRVEFLLSYAAGLSLLALGMAAAQTLCLYIIGGNLFGPSHISWAVSIAFENIIMVNAALFFSMILSSAATAATATAGFYILARLMGQLLGIIDSTGKGTFIYNLMEYILQAISAVMPRLDLMAQTSWLIYGEAVEISSILLQGAIFTILIITAALIDLVRRQF
ncbi:MAG: hypothetical protein KA155_04290 [Alphaproteobacteria bacterium]|jgi:hypothetical protein|nr:hypothetical protein [Alphaproteobacteria bacterium]